MADHSAIVLECQSCGREVRLPYVGNDEVSIENLTGWSVPPLQCPDCDPEKEPVEPVVYSDTHKSREDSGT